MTLQQQVVSLELSKKLEELGVPQDSLHSWCYIEAHGDYELDNGDYSRAYSAFTASELGELIPSSVDVLLFYAGLRLEKTDGNFWTVSYESFENVVLVEKSAGTLADAMAFMLIHLIEKKLITI